MVGRSAVRALARAGLDATLVADGAAAASTVPVALLNPHRGRTGRAHPEDLVALQTTWRWAAELAAEGFGAVAHRSGAVRVADGPKQARSFGSAGLVPTDADAAGVRAPYGAFLVPDGGWLDPAAWLAALTSSAVAHGARCLEGWAVVAAEPRAGGGWRLRASAPERGGHGETIALDAEHVVVATGATAWPVALAASLGPAPEVERIAGDVVVTRRAAPAVPIAGATYVGPVARDGARVAAIGGHHRPPGPPAADAAFRLRAAARWTLPELGDEDPDDRVWWGVRAKRPSGRPEARPMALGVRWLGGFAGRGFLAAAGVAEAVAATLADEPTS